MEPCPKEMKNNNTNIPTDEGEKNVALRSYILVVFMFSHKIWHILSSITVMKQSYEIPLSSANRIIISTCLNCPS